MSGSYQHASSEYSIVGWMDPGLDTYCELNVGLLTLSLPESFAPGPIVLMHIASHMIPLEVCVVQRKKTINSSPDRGSPGLGRFQHHCDGCVCFIQWGVCVIFRHRRS